MEKSPSWETNPDDKYEKELSFDQQVELATVLSKAVGRRNVFIKGQGGFDTFAEAAQYAPEMRKVYDNMEKAVSEARQEFDAKISDKEEFVNKLRKTSKGRFDKDKLTDNDRLADVIDSMFSV